jgi:hypothetical protein
VTLLAAASSNDVAPGTLGFLVVFGMAVVLFFLFRSMSKHLRKVNGVPPKGRAARSAEGRSAGPAGAEGRSAGAEGRSAGPAGPAGAEGRDVDAASARSGATGHGDRREDS